jgi:nucleoid-associated protein YgaU
MRAFVEAIHYYKTERTESLAILGKYLKTSDVAVLTEVYDNVGLRLLPQKPYPTLRGIAVMLRELAPREPKAATARPEQFVDLTFIKELDGSGFIDALYKVPPPVASREPERPESSAVALIPKSAAPVEQPKPAVPAAKTIATPAPIGGPIEYIVVSGDTLSHLAVRYYRDPNMWPKIFEANKDTMKNPHYIFVGQKLMIPS